MSLEMVKAFEAFVQSRNEDTAAAETDSIKGAMYGLAIGDALGAAVEFKYPGEFAPVTCYRRGGPHSLNEGEWTDDTSMALALAESLGTVGWNPVDQMNRYLDWWQNGKYSVNGRCFDIGNATRHALSNYERSKNPYTSGDPDEAASGNGSIMRLAPVPIYYRQFYPTYLDRICSKAEESSMVTHASPQCKSACRYLAAVLAALIRGDPREEVLDKRWKYLDLVRPLHPLIERVVAGSYITKPDSEIHGSGWVVASLEAALWAFRNAESFEEAVLAAVNLGDDADTTGAVCGQLAGAYWGYEGIPKSLIDGLARKDMIDRAIQLINKSYLEI